MRIIKPIITFHKGFLKYLEMIYAARSVKITSIIAMLPIRNECDPGGPNISLYLHNGLYIYREKERKKQFYILE